MRPPPAISSPAGNGSGKNWKRSFAKPARIDHGAHPRRDIPNPDPELREGEWVSDLLLLRCWAIRTQSRFLALLGMPPLTEFFSPKPSTSPTFPPPHPPP